MKDVAACEKLRGAGKRALIRRYPNGETRRKRKVLARARNEGLDTSFQSAREHFALAPPVREYIARQELTRLTETSK